jgi:CIC family chloride channel protein
MKFSKKNTAFVLTIIGIAIFIGLASAMLANSLKIITDYYEHSLYKSFTEHKWLIFVLPLVGLSTINMLRHYLFKNNQNRGIKEVLDSLKRSDTNLPAYKIPSHFFNGFLTVIFGGSTGIEVSTVVASATLGSLSNRKTTLLRNYKTELICAGVAAGITALFSSPLGGILFAYEVFSKKVTKVYVLTIAVAVCTAYCVNALLMPEPLFTFEVNNWHLHAIPYFIILGILAGLNSVYLTKSVLFLKKLFASVHSEVVRVLVGSIAISLLIFFLPQLYGDGYIAINNLTGNAPAFGFSFLLICVFILLAKPIITSVSLAIGGDGGVFAPSLFLGAFLGWFTAFVLQHYFNADIIPINFLVIGMAAVLSASIHAPFTAVFLVCGLSGNYHLFIPLLIACVVSKITAKLILPYNVYNYVAVKN